MAEAIYNRLTNSTDASSAGTHIEGAGDTLAEFNNRPGTKSFTIEVMRDAGFNIEDNKQKQLTKDMLEEYDLVVSMAAKQFTPGWLSSAPNYVYWKISDPRGRSYAVTKHAKDEVERKVNELISRR